MSEGADGDGETTSLGDHLDVRRTVGVVALLVLVALVLPFVIYSVPQVVGAEHSYVVLSGSMAPTIGVGDVILVDSVDPAAIDEGDIVTFRTEDAERPTTHRVIGIDNQDGQPSFQTKGDANEDADPARINAGAIEGRVMSLSGTPIAFPMVGHVIQFANTDLGFTALFVIPLVLFVAFEIRDILSDPNPDSADNEVDADDTQVVADGNGATAEGKEAGEESAGLTFRPIELRLGVVILALFTAYGAWVAYVTREIWSFAVLGMVGTTFVILLGLFLTGGETADASSADDEDDGHSAEPAEAADEASTSENANEQPEPDLSEREDSSPAPESPTEVAAPSGTNADGEPPTIDTDVGQSRGESDD